MHISDSVRVVQRNIHTYMHIVHTHKHTQTHTHSRSLSPSLSLSLSLLSLSLSHIHTRSLWRCAGPLGAGAWRERRACGARSCEAFARPSTCGTSPCGALSLCVWTGQRRAPGAPTAALTPRHTCQRAARLQRPPATRQRPWQRPTPSRWASSQGPRSMSSSSGIRIQNCTGLRSPSLR